MTIIVCIRHPDFANEFEMFGGDPPEIIDVDYGHLNLRDPEEFKSWREGLESAITSLMIEADQSPEKAAAEFLRGLIAEAEEQYDQEGGE